MMRVTGHFGEILQGRLGPDGPLALVTCPCPTLWAEALVTPGPLSLQGSRAVGRGRLVALLRGLGLPLRGRFILRCAMPLGGGAGASTAGLLALAGALGVEASPALMSLVRRIEGASDPLVFRAAERVLWASREGRVLAHLPPLPRFQVVGGFWGQGQRTDARDMAFADVSDLVDRLRSCDLAGLAAVASASAGRCLTLRGPKGDPTEALAARFGALGWLVAHTGSARGLIFAPGMDTDAALAGLRAAGFCKITRFSAGG
ncbi:propanediol utilization protein [Rhodobacter sp. KR11]|uniref:propanediol utilization protein n=1 Tax=Rhodobacter sp. KR11 TaxID=2974588 RepID=UPI002222B5AD|nr:propanediol utilization protein [Rhodobacter sp. KR11]MCW1919461.1 propanediol utilization protein [Rhodobacter sp. KR11]